MIGAVAGTLLLSLTMQRASMPYIAKFVAQVTSGAYIGCAVSKEDFRQFRKIYKVLLVVVGAFLLLNLTTGILLWKFASFDLLTALMCTIPGGISEVSLVSAEMGADVSAVVLLQFVRMCVGLGFFPSWIAWLDRRSNIADIDVSQNIKKTGKTKTKPPVLKLIILFAIAACFGYLGRRMGVPAGVLIFSIMAALLIKLFVFSVSFPKPLKRCAQVLSGCYIGCSISYESLLNIPSLLVPAIFIVIVYMINSFVVGHILNKYFSVPIREAMLMATPAGASDMALISADIGVQSPVLIVTQVLRMLAAASLFPQICYQVVRLFS